MAPRRKKRQRLSFDDKSKLIESALLKEIVHRQVVGYENHLFSMAQIAQLTGYARSNRLLNDLYQMVDREKLRMMTRNDKRGVSDFNVFFTLPEFFKHQEAI